MSAFVTFVIPVYNVETYITECLDSLLAQDFNDWEAIVINDGSTDRSGLICEEYARRDSRIKVFNEPHCGVSTARNVGLDHATGDWIWFVDADDYIESGAISELSVAATSHNCDTIFFGITHRIGEMIRKYSCITTLSGLSKNEFLELIPSYANQAILFSRKLILDTGIKFTPEINMGEDMEFQYKYLLNTSHPIMIKPNLYVYRFREGSVTRNETASVDILRCCPLISKNLSDYILAKGFPYQSWLEKRLRTTPRYMLLVASRLPYRLTTGLKEKINDVTRDYSKAGYDITNWFNTLACSNLRIFLFCYRIYHRLRHPLSSN